MSAENDARYSAYAARDERFDGVFFVGVTSTGIYCRPICPARTPRRANCRFFDNAAAAERERFRPCLRCRPELAPGSAPVDDRRWLATTIADHIGAQAATAHWTLEDAARHFGRSSRQLRRIVEHELGVTPIQLLQTRRLLLAKQLLTDTHLTVGTVAHASGYRSLRRFNDAFVTHYGMPPTRLRCVAGTHKPSPRDSLQLQLGYREPLAWDQLLEFLRARAIRGVEAVDHAGYSRTVRLGDVTGWVRVTRPTARGTLRVELAMSLAPVIPQVLTRLRNLFDLGARPDVIAEQLSADPLLAPLLAARPGLRVPGAFDAFEVAVRAILGQQVSVAGASTLAERFARLFGEPVATPISGLERSSPTPARIAAACESEIAALGVMPSRARTLLTLARALVNDEVSLTPGIPVQDVIDSLQALPGIGPWTAHYVAMRVLRWPDAFPHGDLVLRRRLGALTPARMFERSEGWRPWRSYAAMHLWASG